MGDPLSCAVGFLLCGRFPIYAKIFCSSCAVGFILYVRYIPRYALKVSSSLAVGFHFKMLKFSVSFKFYESRVDFFFFCSCCIVLHCKVDITLS